MILTAITLLIQLLPGILQSTGVISPMIAKLISDLGASVPATITALMSGETVPDATLTVLNEFKTELTALKEDTNLPPHVLGDVNTLILALGNALSAYDLAAIKTDPSTLTDLPTDLESTVPAASTDQAVVVQAAVDAATAAHAAAATATAAAVTAQAAAIAAAVPIAAQVVYQAAPAPTENPATTETPATETPAPAIDPLASAEQQAKEGVTNINV